jgi:acyl transferase domain-containing protein
LKSVYDRYNINPEEIEYIVTHGTGTKLGDPIEINALYDAFKNYTQKQGYCALTSCKTNFGHALAASGLVSLINLVQALHNKVIPASLNCEQENDYINWRESPFYVNKTRKEWLKDDGKARLGAVSAFGMSGTNVHMVLEEYIYKEHTSSINVPYYLFPFSAKTDEVLQEKVNNAILLLESREWSANDLASMSLTLMEGRQHFSHRCAVVIKDREDAIHILKKVCNREKSPKYSKVRLLKILRARMYFNSTLAIFCQCVLPQKVTQTGTVSCYALAELYCQGYEVKLSILYQGEKVYRMHMPTYPFAKEQYWVEDESLNTSVEGAAFIHPLLHSNTSDLSEQRFTTTFTGGEYYEPDYLVKGRKSLPGIAHLEMAHEAVKQAAGYLLDINKNIQLKNITWTETVLFAEQPLQVHTALYQKENGEIVFEIYSNDGQNGEETLIYSSGSAVICHESQLPSVDIKALQQQCTRSILSSSQCSEMFKALGANYSAGIRQLYLGEGIGLSRLSLPDVLSDTLEKFTVHPVILDMAIQASEVIIENSDRIKPLIPVSMQEAEVFGNVLRLCGLYSDIMQEL